MSNLTNLSIRFTYIYTQSKTNLLWIIGAGLIQAFAFAMPGLSAERIYANYGPIERDISVEALETYALTGEITEELAGYSRYLTPEQLEQLRQGLLVSADLDLVSIAQFLYTPQGEAILNGLGSVIQTEGRRNGAKAIRGAVIVAAADPDGGLNVLNFLKHFATEGVRVNLRQLSILARTTISEINQTRQAVEQIREQANQTIDTSDIDYSLVSKIALATDGSIPWNMQRFEQMVLPTNLYVPDGKQVPLVVISHGLGGDRSTLAYIAEHLASHGFVVAVVKHLTFPTKSGWLVATLQPGRVTLPILSKGLEFR